MGEPPEDLHLHQSPTQMNVMPLELDLGKASFGQTLHFIIYNAFIFEAVNSGIVKLPN
jgi:hypothetical protein